MESPLQRHNHEGEGQEACASGLAFRGSPLLSLLGWPAHPGPCPAPRSLSPTVPQFPAKVQPGLFGFPIYTYPEQIHARRAFQFRRLLGPELQTLLSLEPSVTGVSTDDSGIDSHSQERRVQGRKGESGQVPMTGLRVDRRNLQPSSQLSRRTPALASSLGPGLCSPRLPAPSVRLSCHRAWPCRRAPWSPCGLEDTAPEGGDTARRAASDFRSDNATDIIGRAARRCSHRGLAAREAGTKPKPPGYFYHPADPGEAPGLAGTERIPPAPCPHPAASLGPSAGSRESGSGQSKAFLILPSPQEKLSRRQIFRMGNWYLN